MRISDWSSDVCSSDLAGSFPRIPYSEAMLKYGSDKPDLRNPVIITDVTDHFVDSGFGIFAGIVAAVSSVPPFFRRSEEHTSELQSLMRISYAVFCLKKTKRKTQILKSQLSQVHHKE